MFHPVGSQPPSVYWRRRLVFLASIVVVLVLVVLTVNAMRSSSAAKQSAAPPGAARPAASPTPAAAASGASSTPASSTSSASGTASSTARSASGKSSSGSARPTSTAPAAACLAKNLAVQAVPGATNYRVGDKPVLQLQVTDTAATPCVQNLADSQVELRVYNGESRVWGSHDCKIQPGADLRTLAPNTPVRVAVDWSGLSSEPKCAGTRQRVGAGTYTLYALLSGRTGKAAQFSIS